jgi:hypothetical protein
VVFYFLSIYTRFIAAPVFNALWRVKRLLLRECDTARDQQGQCDGLHFATPTGVTEIDGPYGVTTALVDGCAGKEIGAEPPKFDI